ncbi:MAG: RsmF rRNA methyltransferase first C-terminal domain-containing protein [Roseburia sp.]|nr:RsmF rRNA methyltransferase first C-terminal domain-containing protein [Roseburia sp.]MDY5883448.1 RsmF rRNA methyltransferase first C-terminal domain-containing protein [Roseburia sp.]
MLPQEFLDRMRQMLGEEYPAFVESYEKEKYQALRVNALKADWKRLKEEAVFSLEPVPWEPNGFYYGKEDAPGKHPYHEAGVYYIQEPSAMAPAAYLEAKPGERVLDLCAAPGGKTTQIASYMKGQGILISNEIHPARAKILSENVERMGIPNAMVTNESPQKLADTFSEYFDRIMVDAPCSGEGMFRKNEIACEEWSLENVEICAKRQDEILDRAASMLKPGGRIVYSTCTFAPAENEGSISRFLEHHSDFSIVEAEHFKGMEGGVADWVDNPACGIEKTIRLWPNKLHGEGHYVAVLQKDGTCDASYEGYCKNGLQKGISEKECKEYLAFCEEFLKIKLEGTLLKYGDQLYLAPKGMPSTSQLKVLRPGLHLGTMKKNRFEPSHALALSLKPQEAKYVADFPADSAEIRAYLNGQTLNYEGEKGWYLITVDGYSIGWGKLAGGVMKNHYPKGLRKNCF